MDESHAAARTGRTPDETSDARVWTQITLNLGVNPNAPPCESTVRVAIPPETALQYALEAPRLSSTETLRVLEGLLKIPETSLVSASFIDFIKQYRLRVVKAEVENHATCRIAISLVKPEAAWGDDWNPNPLTGR